ncbi:MAG TPA: hypothetical protein VGZ27_05740 [Vicinamibacterales bacterium]|jgi:hypothetical protein|nr:hypothetical protein [Vicinamibacterales bacterium]
MEIGLKSLSSTKGTGRRTLLQRGLALIGGVAAVGTGARWATREVGASALRRGPTLTVYGRKRPVAGDNEARIMAFGELLDAPDGRTIGEFHTNCFCLSTPLGLQPTAGSNLEFHVMQFKDGTLFGLRGGSPGSDAPIPSAVIGGTARYAGASGSLVERPLGAGARGHDLVEFVITFAS